MNSTSSSSTTPGAAKGLSGVNGIRLPPLRKVWSEAVVKLGDPRAKMNAGAALVYEDPVLAIELLRTACSVLYSADKPPVTTIKGAIERLGATVTLATFEDYLKTTPEISDPGISKWVEFFRSRCVRAGKVARVLAEILASSLVDDCQLAGELMYIGDILAVLHFGKTYVEMADANNRTKVLYRLEKDHQFSVDTVGVNYLRKYGIPEIVLFALDEKATVKAPTRVIMKPILSAASELVVAFDDQKWEKYAPGTALPVKSALRILKITDLQYVNIYERSGAILLPLKTKTAAK